MAKQASHNLHALIPLNLFKSMMRVAKGRGQTATAALIEAINLYTGKYKR